MLIDRSKYIISFYIIIVAALLVLSFDVNEADALDLGRYYAESKVNATTYNNLLTFISDQISTDIDFIYQTTLFSAVRLGIPLSLVTIFFLSLFYVSIYKLINTYQRVSDFKYVYLIFILTFCPIVWVLSISRTTAALSFYMLGCLYFKEHRYFKAVMIYLVACFTHISMLIFIILTIIAYAFSKFRYHQIRSLILLGIAIVGFIVPTIIMDAISPYIALMQFRYSYYAEMEMQSPLLASSLGIGDKIPIVFIYILTLYLLIKDKRTDWTYWMLYVCWSLLAFFIWSDVMMTNRIIMLSIPFVGISFYSILSSTKRRNKLSYIAYLGIVVALGALYTYRTVF